MQDSQHDITKSLASIDEQVAKLTIERQLRLDDAFRSGDVNTIYKAEKYYTQLLKQHQTNKSSGMKSLVIDPLDTAASMGYYTKVSVLSYQALRAMARTPIIRAIINTRKDQIAEHCKPQPDKYSRGFVFKKKGVQQDDWTDRDKKTADKLTEFILNCGDDDQKWDLDDFEAFIRKIVEDSLTLDQACFEIVPTRGGEPNQFIAVDAAMFRIADSYDNEHNVNNRQQVKGYYPSYVQVYQGNIIQEFYPWELCFGVRNPSTNIYTSNYGRSELEDLVQVVTSMLNSDKYNGNFFRHGSAPKGALLVKKGNVNPNTIAQLRRDWNAMMSGVEGCVHGDTLIWTKEFGGLEIQNVLRGKDETFVNVWTGQSWEKGRVFKTSSFKQQTTTRLNNGVEITTSPDHRFAIINDEGQFTWKEQRELQVGDCVLVNKKSIGGESIPAYNNQLLSKDMMEILGWSIGDGSLFYKEWDRIDRDGKGLFQLFFHPTKELGILDKFLHTLVEFGLNATKRTNYISEEQIEKGKRERGFKSLSNVQYQIQLVDKNFARFLIDIGFQSSTDKKVIPEFVFNLPDDYKFAFLRGLFSADGNLEFYGGARLTIHNDNLRKQIRNLLLSVGMRTVNCELAIKTNGISENVVNGKFLTLRDKKLFHDNIGFIQAHKQPKAKVSDKTRNCFPNEVIIKYLTKAKDIHRQSKIFTFGQYRDLKAIIRGDEPCSYDRFIKLIKIANVEYPKFWDEYYFESVIELTQSQDTVQMYDVEVFDDVHAFVGDGVIIHNSHKTPVLDAEAIEWLDLHKNNRDMEFSKFQEYLIRVACAVYKISPEEVGFPLGGTQNTGIGSKEGGAQEKEYSMNKGLRPLLTSVASWINKYVVGPKTNWQWSFSFSGLDVESVKDENERLAKAVSTYMEVNEVRVAKGLKPKKGYDIILNPIISQMRMMEQQQQQQQQQFDDRDEQNTNPFLDQGEDNPFEKAFNEFCEQEFLVK